MRRRVRHACKQAVLAPRNAASFCEHFEIANPLKRAAITFLGASLCSARAAKHSDQQQRTSSSTAVGKQQLHRQSTVFE
jgi:hypothetical protein